METMKAKHLLKYAIPALALAAAGLMMGCNKPDEVVDDPYAEPIDPVKVLKFGKRDIGYDSIEYNNVMKYANDPRITTIIYLPDSTNNNNDYTGLRTKNISQLRADLTERLNYTPKATGAGTFIFGKDEAAPEDSLWFVQNGWQIRTR
ncbi:MAG: hypothetical protein K2L79_00140 [Bacteroidales bacterium]|nr:hypothetical protein [Bacteroidales bacterium]